MSSEWILPPRSAEWALFLDVDGTLLEIAPAPDAVRVDPGLPPLLAALGRRLGGALALISGRSLATLDEFFRPFRFPAAGIHGVERRDVSGTIHQAGLRPEDLQPARAALQAFAAAHPGVLLEDKGRSLALHYRRVPELRATVESAAQQVLALLPAEARLQPGHCVLEIKSGAANKRTAIEQFMQEPPFRGRVPVFVGDDVTDRDGFAYVESAGGHALFVGPEPEPGRGWLPDPAAVRAWLGGLLA